MTLEQQVCSLELSKKLKELGVKQESLWYWQAKYKSIGELELYYSLELNENGDGVIIYKIPQGSHVSAFTVAELGELLKKHGNFISGCGLDTEKEYYCTRVSLPEFEIWSENFVEADTEADARAKMLVYLIENKLITK